MIISYICPCCSSELCVRGAMLCCQGCQNNFPIQSNIPRFVVSKSYADSFGFQWNRHGKAQLDSYTKNTISQDRLFQATGWSNDLSGETILEAGSGAGRFTEVLLNSGAYVYSFDFSNAIEANYKNNGYHKNLILFQASIYNIPLPRASFNKVLCLGVLQHTPDPERAFRELVSFVKPGGEIVIDVYKKTASALLQWKYFLRPLLKRLSKERLYSLVTHLVNFLLPTIMVSKRVLGRVGARLFPIVEYSELGLSKELNREWAILDTFDMYSPTYDKPQTMKTVCRWFCETGLKDIEVCYGPNGIIGKGIKPLLSTTLNPKP